MKENIEIRNLENKGKFVLADKLRHSVNAEDVSDDMHYLSKDLEVYQKAFETFLEVFDDSIEGILAEVYAVDDIFKESTKGHPRSGKDKSVDDLKKEMTKFHNEWMGKFTDLEAELITANKNLRKKLKSSIK